VNHGGNESVEVFEVDLGADRPSLKWIGGVALPGTTAGDNVAAVDDGFVVSTIGDPEGRSEVSVEQAMAGADTGGVLEWSPDAGWAVLAGTQINTANGVAVSPDGQWLYIGGWNSRCLRKVRRGAENPEPTTVSVSIMVDNLTWAASGRLLAAGTYGTSMQEFLDGHLSKNPRLGFPSRVISVDPETLAAEVLIDYGPDTFGAATTALQVGREIWVGTARDQGLARFRFPAQSKN
jgi:sugar lactone lactonase YvrE